MKRGFIMKGAEEERGRKGRESQTARPERKVWGKAGLFVFLPKKVEAAAS